MLFLSQFFKFLTLFHLLAQCQCGYVQEAKRHIRAEFRDVLGPPSYYGSHWHHGHRVHRVHMPHASQRWRGRRRSINHPHPFSRWTQWSSCNEDCIRHRERYCKVKRKCGHTKHMEQQKCSHCHPSIKWHHVESNVQQHTHPNYNYNPQPIPNPPAIVINAAAAAASGPHLQSVQPTPLTSPQPPPPPSTQPQPHPTTTYPHLPEDSIEIVHRRPHPTTAYPHLPEDSIEIVHRRPHPHPTIAYPHPPEDSIEIVHRRPHPTTTYPHPTEDSIEIVHRRPHPPKYWPPIDSSLEDEAEDEEPPFEPDEGDFFVLKRHRRKQRPKHSSRHTSKYNARHRNREKHKYDYMDDDFEDYMERKSFSLQQRSLGSSSENLGLEGDIFQYEDFDIEPDSDSTDSEEYPDIRNGSFLLPSKERNTPDGLQARHRRLYSKWSRWSKCSPKCTTRRYKKCRLSEQCGREVLREIAYCYTENSFCQQWLQTQVQKAPAYESSFLPRTPTRPVPGTATAMRRMHTEPVSASLSKNDVNVIMSGKGYRGPEYSPLKLQCGLVRNGHRSMYNMLKIIGGKAARKGEWPWQVAIFNRFKEAFCGGTLIAPMWVLTAAHCVRKVLYVRFGEHNLDYEDGTEVQLRVLKSFKHPNFDKRTVDSDVALLRLPKPVNATSWIGYSCLPRPFQPLPKNVDCTVIGWGKRRNRDVVGTSVLHQADVPIIPMENCRSVYHDYTITKNMFCAGHRRGRIDTCAGDSGGPLLCRDSTKANHPWTIFGITSFGDGCAKRNKFGIYAKVPNYVDWVWSVVNCNGNCKLH